MKKFFKKVVVLMLTLAMIVPIMAGCGGGDESETITLNIYSQLANFSGEQKGWSAKVALDKFNVIMNIIPEGDGVFQTRMESGDLGDIVIWGSDGSQYQQAVAAGLLYDWEEDNLLTEYGPYIAEHMSNALEKNREINGGKLYGFGHNVAPSSDDHDAFFYTWDLRWDLYKELGYPEYKTLDDFVEVLADMKEICPTDENGNETYAVSLWPDWDGNMVMYVKALATAYWGYDELGIGLYDADNGQFHGALEENGPYLQSLKFFNNLYQRGLLDPNSMTQTYDEMSEKLIAGGTFFSIFNYAGCLSYNTPEHVAQNKMMMSWMPSDATPIVYGLSTLGGNRVWSIGANTQYPELCMELINWFCTPEGCMTYNYGPQGLTWDYDEEGYPYFTEFGKTACFDKETEMIGDYEGTGNYNDGTFQFNNTTWTTMAVNPETPNQVYNYQFWKSYQQDAQCDIEQDWRDYTGCTSTEEFMNSHNYKVSPGSAYQEGKKEETLENTWNAVKDAIITYSWRAIYAADDASFDSIVAEMIEQADSYGYADCVAWSENESATRYAAEQKAK